MRSTIASFSPPRSARLSPAPGRRSAGPYGTRCAAIHPVACICPGRGYRALPRDRWPGRSGSFRSIRGSTSRRDTSADHSRGTGRTRRNSGAVHGIGRQGVRAIAGGQEPPRLARAAVSASKRVSLAARRFQNPKTRAPAAQPSCTVPRTTRGVGVSSASTSIAAARDAIVSQRCPGGSALSCAYSTQPAVGLARGAPIDAQRVPHRWSPKALERRVGYPRPPCQILGASRDKCGGARADLRVTTKPVRQKDARVVLRRGGSAKTPQKDKSQHNNRQRRRHTSSRTDKSPGGALERGLQQRPQLAREVVAAEHLLVGASPSSSNNRASAPLLRAARAHASAPARL